MREQEVRELYEAYLQVHQVQEEVEVVDEAREANRDPEGYEERQRTSQSSRQRRMNDPHTGINSPAFNAFMAQQMGGKKKKKVDEETDLFDTILEYLVAEGYADTNKSALVIMANMSEGWRQDIMEISQKTATRAYAQSYTGEFEGHDDASDVRRTDSLRGHIERKFGKKASEDADRHADANTFGRKDPRTGKRQPKPQSRFQNPNRYRTRADGKMHGQDQNKLKAKLQKRSSSDSDNA